MPKRGYHHGNLKEALIEAALVLIREKGPTGFTLSEAAKRAGVTPAAVYRHFEGREDLIAEAALQGHQVFADLMEHAYRDGQTSAFAAFEAMRRAYLAFARVHPGHYIAMFESGISVNRTTELSHASQRARSVMDRARSDVRISATRRADVGDLKGHLDYYYHLAGHPKQLRSRRAVASALGLSGDW